MKLRRNEFSSHKPGMSEMPTTLATLMSMQPKAR